MPGSDSEIVVLLTAETAQFKEGMTAGAESVKQSTDAMRASVSEAMSQFAAFDAIQKGSIQTAGDLAAAQDALSAAQASGAFTAEELAAKQAIIAGAMNKVGQEAEATAGFIDKVTGNSRTMYSVSALVSDAMTGQFGRMRREVSAVANETGALGTALQYLLTPAGLVAAALAGIAAAAIAAKDAVDKLATSVAAGGGMAGMSKDQLEGMAQGFKQAGYDVSTARAAIDALSASGKVSAESMQSAAQASLDLAQLTGTDADKIASQISKLGSSGLDGILRMDQQYHFLNDSQRTHIAQMFQEGQATEGVKEAFNALATTEHSRVEALKKDQGDVEGFWSRMGTHIANAWDSTTKTMHMGLTDSQQVEQLNKVIAYQQRIGGGEEYINQLVAKRDALLERIAQRNKDAASEGIKASKGADQDEAMLHSRSGGAGGLEKALLDQEALQKVSYDHRAEFEMEYWGEILQTAKAGSAEYTLAWQKSQELQKQIDSTQLEQWRRNEAEKAAAARKAASDAAEAHRKAAETAMNAAEMDRDATLANSAERIQADAAVLASATKLYGAESSQQKAALSQMLADSRSYDASVKALDLERLTLARDNSLKDLDNKRSAYQLEYSEGQISASELLQLEDHLSAQKLAIEKNYLDQKKKLDAGDVASIIADNGAITKAQQEYQARLLAAEKEYHKNSEKEWKNHAKKVEGAMQGAINGMLFQHQTLRQGLANVAMVIGEEFIQDAVMKPLDKWIAAESAKVSASLSTSASLDAQRVANGAADAAASSASVARAAGVAGAQGTASFSGAPWPVDMGAPAFGAAMAAASLSYASVASAAGGWERVPFDGAMTELHKDEMVLPAHIANPMRQMAKQGGQGGGQSIHIHAVDARSVKELFRREKGSIATAMKLAHRRGYFGKS